MKEDKNILKITNKNKKIVLEWDVKNRSNFDYNFLDKIKSEDLKFSNNLEPEDIFLEGYKKLINVTYKFLKKFGDVEQEKNNFSLKSTDPDFIKGHRDYMHELEQALYDEFEEI